MNKNQACLGKNFLKIKDKIQVCLENFNIETVSYYKCKVKGNYKQSDVV